jgi:hypothetical protein
VAARRRRTCRNCTSIQNEAAGNRFLPIGAALSGHHAAAGSGTLAVRATPVIVRVQAASPGYCAGVSDQAPPKWPECTHGPPGGALDRSSTVDYRRD